MCGTDQRGGFVAGIEDGVAFVRRTRTQARTKAIAEIEIRNHSFVPDAIWLSNARARHSRRVSIHE